MRMGKPKRRRKSTKRFSWPRCAEEGREQNVPHGADRMGTTMRLPQQEDSMRHQRRVWHVFHMILSGVRLVRTH